MDENGSSGIIHNIDGTGVRNQGIIFAIDLDHVFCNVQKKF